MTFFFRREIRVTTSGFVITEPRIHANIKLKADQSQDKGVVTVYNLNRDHEQQIYESGGGITVEAGYPNLTGRIFQGIVTRIDRVRQDLSRQVKMSVGNRALSGPSSLGGRTSRTYIHDRFVRSILRDLVEDDLGMALGPLDAIPIHATVHNFSPSGATDEAMTKLLATVNATWFNDDGIIRVRTIESPRQSDAPTIRVTPDHGLIGAPKVSDRGVQFEMFLNPLVRRGSLVILESETIAVRDYAVAIEHDADNWHGRFVTKIDMREPGDD